MEGEMTTHAINREWGENLGKIAIVVNDGNLLFSSFAQRTRVRLWGALSALLTEGRYHYGDFRTSFTLKGQISLIFNLATPQYQRHKRELVETTLDNRILTLHAWVNNKEQFETKEKYSKTIGLKPPIKIDSLRNRTIKNLSEYSSIIIHYADDYSALAVRAPGEIYDLLLGMVNANCAINDRNRITGDEIFLIKLLKDYIKDPATPDTPRVIELLKQGRSYGDICNILGKGDGYKSTISKINKKLKFRGDVE
jgi:hypothetical protein